MILSGLLIDFVVAVVLSKRRCSIPGKSSIVCAIAIGLGAQTKLLGRSDNLGEFVMQGCDNGYVEIEIYRPGSPNSVHHSNLPFCSMQYLLKHSLGRRFLAILLERKCELGGRLTSGKRDLPDLLYGIDS